MSRKPIGDIPTYRRLIADDFPQRGTDYKTYRPTGSNDHLLILTTAGAGRFREHGESALSAPGSLMLYAPGASQDYVTHRPRRGRATWSLLWAHFQPWPHWRELLDWPPAAPGMQLGRIDLPDPAARAEAEQFMHEAIAANHTAQPHAEVVAMNALERLLLLCDSYNPQRHAHTLDSRIETAIERVHADLAAPLTVSDLAATAHLSPSRFAHLFTEQLGQSPMQYLDARRIDRARDLLAATQEPISAIAAAVGFSAPLYFSRRFKQATGLSPRAYRQQLAAP